MCVPQDAGHTDDLIPYFLRHARTIFPHLECMDDLKKISDLREPANWWVRLGRWWDWIRWADGGRGWVREPANWWARLGRWWARLGPLVGQLVGSARALLPSAKPGDHGVG